MLAVRQLSDEGNGKCKIITLLISDRKVQEIRHDFELEIVEIESDNKS